MTNGLRFFDSSAASVSKICKQQYGLGLVADSVTQAIWGSEFEDGLMPGSPGDVLSD